MEEMWEKLGLVICAVGILIIFTVISLVFFMPHTFEGYYLSNGHIDASYKWTPDEVAFDYTPEMWKAIIENDLQYKPKR